MLFGTIALGDVLDTVSIGIFALLISLILAQKLFTRISYQVVSILGIFSIAFLLEQLPYLNGSLVYLFLFITLGLILYLLSHKTSVATIIMCLLFLGLLARILDIQACNTLVIGTHFIWHIAVALAVFFIVKIVIQSPRTMH